MGRREYDSARRPHPFVEELVELFRYRDLVALWSARNVTLRYKRSFLGIAWTLLEPLMMMLIITFVFSQVFRFAVASYAVYVLTGIVVFDFFSRATTMIVDEIVASQSLAQRIHLPRSAFAVAAVASNLANWGLALIPLAVIMMFQSVPFSWTLLSVPFAMLVTALFALGVGLVVATIGAFFHDVKLTYNVLLTAWFYATPVIYPLEVVPESFQRAIRFNPLYYALELFRTSVLEGALAPPSLWLAGGFVSFATATIGWWCFTRWRQAIEYQA